MPIEVEMPTPAVGQKCIDPTPEEIRERCLDIQAGWTVDERRRRLAGTHRPSVEARSTSARVQLPAGITATVDSDLRNGRTSLAVVSGGVGFDD
jgi:hypothetical protein